MINMGKCLVFDIWGDYGHFRKYYTTSSPLTHSLPPRTTICGMIAAIIGIDKSEYIKYFTKDQADIAVRIMRPVKKVRIGYNYIETKNADQYMAKFNNHTPVNVEFVKDPAYRIYISHKNKDISDKLKTYLENHQCVYTLCMGLSECIANYKYAGEWNMEKVSGNEGTLIHSVIPLSQIEGFEMKMGGEYFKETMPNEMDISREILEYKVLLYERKGEPIECSINQYITIGNGDHVLFI